MVGPNSEFAHVEDHRGVEDAAGAGHLGVVDLVGITVIVFRGDAGAALGDVRLADAGEANQIFGCGIDAEHLDVQTDVDREDELISGLCQRIPLPMQQGFHAHRAAQMVDAQIVGFDDELVGARAAGGDGDTFSCFIVDVEALNDLGSFDAGQTTVAVVGLLVVGPDNLDGIPLGLFEGGADDGALALEDELAGAVGQLHNHRRVIERYHFINGAIVRPITLADQDHLGASQ